MTFASELVMMSRLTPAVLRRLEPSAELVAARVQVTGERGKYADSRYTAGILGCCFAQLGHGMALFATIADRDQIDGMTSTFRPLTSLTGQHLARRHW